MSQNVANQSIWMYYMPSVICSICVKLQVFM